MSETLAAVAITGGVTLVATWIGPIITERASRKREQASRRASNALELRPLAIAAINDTRAAIHLTQDALSAGLRGRGALAEFDSRDERGRGAYFASHTRAKTVLTELQLATGDRAVNQAISSLLSVLEKQWMLVAELHLERGAGDPIDSTVIRLIDRAQHAALVGLKVLRTSIQPLTVLDGITAMPEVDRDEALQEMDECVAEMDTVIAEKSGD